MPEQNARSTEVESRRNKVSMEKGKLEDILSEKKLAPFVVKWSDCFLARRSFGCG